MKVLDTCALPLLVGDERRFKQVLVNLYKNALKYTIKGRIDLRVNYDPVKNLLIGQVRDTGAGIDKNDLPKLFSKFGKLHRTADANHDGIGLGLAIVHQIIKKSAGKVSATSHGLGHGSIFIFSMKMSPVSEQDQ